MKIEVLYNGKIKKLDSSKINSAKSLKEEVIDKISNNSKKEAPEWAIDLQKRVDKIQAKKAKNFKKVFGEFPHKSKEVPGYNMVVRAQSIKIIEMVVNLIIKSKFTFIQELTIALLNKEYPGFFENKLVFIGKNDKTKEKIITIEEDISKKPTLIIQ